MSAPVTVAMFNFISVEQTMWAKLAAAAIVTMAPVLLLGLFAQRHIVERPDGRRSQRGWSKISRAGRVALKSVVKRHGAFTALHGIDLEIEPGEFFALLGPSRSGKSTTLQIIAGLEEANEGRVFIDGDDVTDADPGDRDVAIVL